MFQVPYFRGWVLRRVITRVNLTKREQPNDLFGAPKGRSLQVQNALAMNNSGNGDYPIPNTVNDSISVNKPLSNVFIV